MKSEKERKRAEQYRQAKADRAQERFKHTLASLRTPTKAPDHG